MSQDDAETVRSFYAAFNQRDLVAMRAVVDDAVVIEEKPSFNPSSQTYRGWEEARGYWDSWFKFWKSIEAEVARVTAGDGGIFVASVHVTVVGREGLEVSDDWGNILTLRDGKVVRIELHRTPDDALQSAGLDGRA